MRYLLVLLMMIVIFMLAPSVYAMTILVTPSQLLAQAQVIAIVEPQQSSEAGKEVACKVLKLIKGTENNDVITMRFPKSSMEEGVTIIVPQEGSPLLVFLRKNVNGIYTAPFGGQCVRNVEKDEIENLVRQLADFILWDKLDAKKRQNALGVALCGTKNARLFALDWLLCEEKKVLTVAKGLSDKEVEGIVSSLLTDNFPIKRRALMVIGEVATTVRTDLVPYLVDMLDNEANSFKFYAMNKLDGRAKGPGPELDATASEAQKVFALKAWWSSTGAKDKKYKRYELPKTVEKAPEK